MKKIILSVLVCFMAVLLVACGSEKPAASSEGGAAVEDSGYADGYQILYDKVSSEDDVWGMSLDEGITFGFVISDDGDLSWCVNSEFDSGDTFTSLSYDKNAEVLNVTMKTEISGMTNYTFAEIYPATYNIDTNSSVYNLDSDATWADEETLSSLMESSVKIIMIAAESMIGDLDLTMADLGFTAY